MPNTPKKKSIHAAAEKKINAGLKSGKLIGPDTTKVKKPTHPGSGKVQEFSQEIEQKPEKKFAKILGQEKVKKALEVGVKQNTPVLLIGETGSGKTSLVRELAIKHGKTFSRFNMTGETSVDEFVGKFTLKKGETIWQDGMLLQAMKEGHWLVVDEINVALPEILLVMNSLLDDDRKVTVANHDGEVVECHEEFRFFATMNPTDEYAGTKELNKAFLSRFGIVQEVSYPSRSVEVNILKQAGVEEKVAMQLVDTAIKIREDKSNGRVYYTCSTRDLLHWGALVADLGLQRAFELAVLNKSINDKDQLIKSYKSVNGDYEMLERETKGQNVQDILNEVRNLKYRQEQLTLAESNVREMKQMAQAELERVKKLEARSYEAIKAEVVESVRQRMMTAVDFVGQV